MIFANSPQVKGRVERHDSSAQMRLPTDLVRFGVGGYDVFNGRFNDFHAPYLCAKLLCSPLYPIGSFMRLPASSDLSETFRTKKTRLSHGCPISCRGVVCMMANADGVLLEVPDDARLAVHVDAITEGLYVERSGR